MTLTFKICRFRTSRSNGAGRLRFSIKWIVFQRGGRGKGRGRPGKPAAGPERKEEKEEEEEGEDGGGEEEAERGEGGEGQVGLTGTGFMKDAAVSRHRFGLLFLALIWAITSQTRSWIRVTRLSKYETPSQCSLKSMPLK